VADGPSSPKADRVSRLSAETLHGFNQHALANWSDQQSAGGARHVVQGGGSARPARQVPGADGTRRPGSAMLENLLDVKNDNDIIRSVEVVVQQVQNHRENPLDV
jgi:hypothetical protein